MSTVKRCGLITVLLGLVLGSPFALISTWAQSSDAPLSQDWSNVRKALEKYQDVVVAIRDGYFSSVLCVQDETAAGWGSTFLNRALLGPAADPMRPQILLYEPVGDKLQLVAAEWFIPLATGVKEALQTQPGGPVPALQRQPEMSEGRVHSHSGARKKRSASMSKTTASALSHVPNS
jgi:hypothetical protein